MEMIAGKLWVTRETKQAFNKAAMETGKMKRVILKEALEDWLINYGYMEEEDEEVSKAHGEGIQGPVEEDRQAG